MKPQTHSGFWDELADIADALGALIDLLVESIERENKSDSRYLADRLQFNLAELKNQLEIQHEKKSGEGHHPQIGGGGRGNISTH